MTTKPWLKRGRLAVAALAVALFVVGCGNQVANPTFVDNIDGWDKYEPSADVTGNLAHDPATSADENGGSLSLENTSLLTTSTEVEAYYCIPSTVPGQRYSFVAAILAHSQASDGQAELRIEWFSGSSCVGVLTGKQPLEGTVVGPSGEGWAFRSAVVTAPPGAGSVAIGFGVTNRPEDVGGQLSFTSRLDNVYFAPVLPQRFVALVAADGD
jgi:hypothetical protein